MRANYRSAGAEAIANLSKGPDLLARLPDGPDRDGREIDLQIALGIPLSETKGRGSERIALSPRHRSRPGTAGTSLELRASASLARLWAKRGERRKAYDLLAPIYATFTEGFGIPDLIEAKVLLDELH